VLAARGGGTPQPCRNDRRHQRRRRSLLKKSSLFLPRALPLLHSRIDFQLRQPKQTPEKTTERLTARFRYYVQYLPRFPIVTDTPNRPRAPS
jgi:hypothetical protein